YPPTVYPTNTSVRPSGETSGHVAPPGRWVIWYAAAPPSIGASTRLNGCSCGATAATIARPSGRHVGVATRVRGWEKTTRIAFVATPTTTISGNRRSRWRSPALTRPSGDPRRGVHG